MCQGCVRSMSGFSNACVSEKLALMCAMGCFMGRFNMNDAWYGLDDVWYDAWYGLDDVWYGLDDAWCGLDDAWYGLDDAFTNQGERWWGRNKPNP